MLNKWGLAWLIVVYVGWHALRNLIVSVMEIFNKKVLDSEFVVLFLLLFHWVTN